MTKDEILDIMYCYLHSNKENVICYTSDNIECLLPITQLFACLLNNTNIVYVKSVITGESIAISYTDLQC